MLEKPTGAERGLDARGRDTDVLALRLRATLPRPSEADEPDERSRQER